VDAQGFIDFYAAKGWKVGNQSMVDWKAAVRTWERNANPRAPPPKSRIYNPATDPPYNPHAED
jgi:hypothetical protein